MVLLTCGLTERTNSVPAKTVRMGKGDLMQRFRNLFSNRWLYSSLAACFIMVGSAALAQAQDPDQITAADVAGFPLGFSGVNLSPMGKTPTQQATLPGIPGIDSVPNFSGAYTTPGFGPSGKPRNNWLFNTLGNAPDQGGATMVNAPIVPVSLDFRNADGSPRFVRVVNGRAITCGTPIEPGCNRLFFDANTAGSGGTTFLQRVLDSPVFSNSNYTSSGTPTQFADAVQRAEFQGAPDSWHTLLAPSVKTTRTMVINQDPTCGIGRGLGGHCSYLYALNPDGRCCFFVLLDVNVFVNELFPPTFQFPPPANTPVGAAEAAGDITTKDVATFFFPPAYLFIPIKHARPCCIGGFHSFDVEPGDASNGNLLRAFVLNYSTWDQPIFRDPTVLDVAGLSHEISETYNDPFVAVFGPDITPWWLSPNGNCQDNLEVGDVIEGLPHQTFPITMPNGFTYHPQNEALLQWFEFQSPSTALNGAYSYPDTSVLTALSAPQKAGCTP